MARKSQLATVPQELKRSRLGDLQTLADLDTYKTAPSKDEKARNSIVQTGLLACAFKNFCFDLASGFELDLQRSC